MLRKLCNQVISCIIGDFPVLNAEVFAEVDMPSGDPVQVLLRDTGAGENLVIETCLNPEMRFNVLKQKLKYISF